MVAGDRMPRSGDGPLVVDGRLVVAEAWTGAAGQRLLEPAAKSPTASLSSVCASSFLLSGRFQIVTRNAALVSAAMRCVPSQWMPATVSTGGGGNNKGGGADFLQPPAIPTTAAASKPQPKVLFDIAPELIQNKPGRRKRKGRMPPRGRFSGAEG